MTYFAQGGNTYSSQGVKVMKFHLIGDQRLDPSTVHVMLQVNNRDAAERLRAIHLDPAVMFSRMRISAGGVVCEDISDANRLSLMLDALPVGMNNQSRKLKDFLLFEHKPQVMMSQMLLLLTVVVLSCSNHLLVCFSKIS